MSAAPWLTVVLPTHHGEAWLDATLSSLAKQTEGGFECVLVDSSTNDATLAIAGRWTDRLDLRLLHRPDLPTWQAKTNLGVTLAGATHVCMLHQDDLWMPARAASVRGWIAAEPDLALHLHPSFLVDDRGERIGRWRCPLPPDTTLASDTVVSRLIVQNFMAICAPVVRRDRFLACGGLDETLWYTADWDLWLKLARAGSVKYHPAFLTGYRVHAGALTVSGSRDADGFEAQLVTVMRRHLPAIGDGRPDVVARADASIAINVALAGALHGRRGALLHALGAVLRLGPARLPALMRDTRLVERTVPRLRMLASQRLRGRPRSTAGDQGRGASG